MHLAAKVSDTAYALHCRPKCRIEKCKPLQGITHLWPFRDGQGKPKKIKAKRKGKCNKLWVFYFIFTMRNFSAFFSLALLTCNTVSVVRSGRLRQKLWGNHRSIFLGTWLISKNCWSFFFFFFCDPLKFIWVIWGIEELLTVCKYLAPPCLTKNTSYWSLGHPTLWQILVG